MYNYFEGPVTEITPTYVVIDCGGVGYLLNISLHTYSQIQKLNAVKLYAHHVVREDAQLLHGFFTVEERDIFRKLISVSGIGANTARLIQSSLSPDEIRHAIMTANVAPIQKVKGIGEKTAQRIIVDLKGKIDGGIGGGINALFVSGDKRNEVLSALSALGFQKSASEKAVDKVIAAAPIESSVEELIKLCLKIL